MRIASPIPPETIVAGSRSDGVPIVGGAGAKLSITNSLPFGSLPVNPVP